MAGVVEACLDCFPNVNSLKPDLISFMFRASINPQATNWLAFWLFHRWGVLLKSKSRRWQESVLLPLNWSKTKNAWKTLRKEIIKLYFTSAELFVKKVPTVDKIKWESEYCHGHCRRVSYSWDMVRMFVYHSSVSLRVVLFPTVGVQRLTCIERFCSMTFEYFRGTDQKKGTRNAVTAFRKDKGNLEALRSFCKPGIKNMLIFHKCYGTKSLKNHRSHWTTASGSIQYQYTF